MLNKLIKYDLKRNFSWLWILSAITVAVSGLTRLIGLGSGSFFIIIKGIFGGITAALIANILIQPFVRFFVTFQKDVYGDESYLTHTLPVNKDHILFSRYISALVQLIFAIFVTILSFFILNWSPEMGAVSIQFIEYVIQNFAEGGGISAYGLIIFIFFLLVFAFILLTATGYTSVIISNKCPNKRTLITVILAIALMYVQNLVIGLISLGVAYMFGASLSAVTLPARALIAMMAAYLILEIILIVVNVLVSRHLFKKGVNVD